MSKIYLETYNLQLRHKSAPALQQYHSYLFVNIYNYCFVQYHTTCVVHVSKKHENDLYKRDENVSSIYNHLNYHAHAKGSE